jgi:hypothetical protein
MFNHRKTREYTCMLLDMMDEGAMDPKAVAEMCLAYMSEDEVKDMCRSNDILPADEQDEDEEEESDPMDDFNYVGSRHHY